MTGQCEEYLHSNTRFEANEQGDLAVVAVCFVVGIPHPSPLYISARRSFSSPL